MNADGPILALYNADALRDEALFARCYALAPPSRQRKVDALRQSADRRLSLAAGMLTLRYLPNARQIREDEHGKPYLPESGVSFNLSHAGRWAVLAASVSPVGVDIERIRSGERGVARRFFCPEETALLDAIPDETQRNAMFFRLWTLKESFLKATGLGLSLPLNAFCVTFRNGAPEVRQSVDGRSWRLKEYFCVEGYALSVCAENAGDYPGRPARADVGPDAII